MAEVRESESWKLGFLLFWDEGEDELVREVVAMSMGLVVGMVARGETVRWEGDRRWEDVRRRRRRRKSEVDDSRGPDVKQTEDPRVVLDEGGRSMSWVVVRLVPSAKVHPGGSGVEIRFQRSDLGI
jgi:hypothetical protein